MIWNGILTPALLSTTSGLQPAFTAEVFKDAGIMILFGMVMVFAVLALLWLILAIFKVIFAGREPKKEKEAIEPKTQAAPAAASAPVTVATDDTALIAVLTAAVAAYRVSEENGSPTGFRVVSFRRTNGGRSWNTK